MGKGSHLVLLGGTSDDEDRSRMRSGVSTLGGPTSLSITISTSAAVSNSLVPSSPPTSPSVTSPSPPAVQMASPVFAPLIVSIDSRARSQYPPHSSYVQALFQGHSATEVPTAPASPFGTDSTVTAVAVKTQHAIGNPSPSPDVDRAVTPRPVPPESMLLILSLDLPSSSTSLFIPVGIPPPVDSPIEIELFGLSIAI
ncbi:hypothetical protein PQX77_017338 [Marasmius sp. AFHP31]|nr:hypothetical protein PQX77_017338 [Marasmius sp. AFHP31]